MLYYMSPARGETFTNRVIVYTHSLSVIKTLQQQLPKPSHQLRQEIRQVANNLHSFLEIVWIPSHVGIPGNERADKLAATSLSKSAIDINLIPELQYDYRDVDNFIFK